MSHANSPVSLSTSQALFTCFFLLFTFILLNGYVLNLVGGYRADFVLVTVGVVAEFFLTAVCARGRVAIERDLLEGAGFLIVILGVWIYFVAASLPTLLPPTLSEDAVRVYLQVLFSYPEGKLVSWYPAGGTFVAATLSHWLNVEPLRVLHPTAASFVAFSAGAVYGMMCEWLRRISPQPPLVRGERGGIKITALLAPALLFVLWSYFAGIINWEQYFFAQAFAQYFMLAALWFIASYFAQPSWLNAALIALALLGVVAAYPVFVALPLAVYALMLIVRTSPLPFLGGGLGWRSGTRTLVAFAIFIALLILAALALQRGGILEFKAGQIATTSAVGPGGVADPSLETLGGPIFIALALAGIPFAWRGGMIGKTIIAFLLAWILQYIALVVAQPFFQISGYRVDKTFYILVYPFAILAAYVPARIFERVAQRFESSSRALAIMMIGTLLVLGASVAVFRPPKFFSPLTESELQTALWAKENLDTYQINSVDPSRIRAYWLVFGIWRETVPNEWFQWIPDGNKLGPNSIFEWLNDPAWSRWIFVHGIRADDRALPPTKIVYQNGDSAILEKELTDEVAPTPTIPSRWQFGSTMRLLGYDLARSRFAPGDTIALVTYAETILPPAATVAWRAQLIDYKNAVVSKIERDPFGGKYPLQRWAPRKFTREEWALAIDPRATPGAYRLELGMFHREAGDLLAVSPEAGELKNLSTVPIAKIKIPVPPPSADELRRAMPLRLRVGENFSLPSYSLQADRAARRIRLTLYWQSEVKTERDYTVFVHLLDANGKVVAQIDQPPLGGIYPTSIWDEDEIVKDDYDFAIPSDASAPLSLEIGMYATPDLKRLEIRDSKGNLIGDHFLIMSVVP